MDMKFHLKYFFILFLIYSCVSNSEKNIKSYTKENIEAVLESEKIDEIKDLYKTLSHEIFEKNKFLEKIEHSLNLLDSTRNIINVNYFELRDTTVYKTLETVGIVKTDYDITISSETNAILNKIIVKKGQWVKKGDTLAFFDDNGLGEQLKSLNADLDLVAYIFNKKQKLWKQNIGSEVDFIKSKSDKNSLEKRIEQVQKQFSKTLLIAPFDGYVNSIFPKEKEFIAFGTPIVRLINPSKFYIVSRIPETYLLIVLVIILLLFYILIPLILISSFKGL